MKISRLGQRLQQLVHVTDEIVLKWTESVKLCRMLAFQWDRASATTQLLALIKICHCQSRLAALQMSARVNNIA